MRMVSTLYTFQIVIVVSMVWRPSYAVNQLSCGATTNLNPSTAATYRFGDYTNPYGTGISCNFNFIPSDASERIVFQVFPQCTPSADVLKIDDSDNKCCYGCSVPISTKSSSFQVSLTTDSTTGPQELGFEIKIVTGKDESNCTTSNPSSNTSVSVGASPVIITSPDFPNKYQSNRDCSYIITPQDSSKGLSLTFDVISLDYYKKCFDYIELGIYNTEDKICTNYTNELFLTNKRYTSGGETYLHFYSDASYEGYGFRVRIIQVDLGATQPPTAASTTAVQTVVSTTSETTAASTTASQTTKTTAASATVGTTAETTSETTPTSEPTAAPATVPHTDPTTVNQLLCGATTNLNPSTAATYRFGDYTNPHGTGISCNFNFIPSDASERILFQVFPQCTPSADVLKIDNGDNKCCYGCTVPISTKNSSFQVSLTTDSNTGPQELGFEIKIVTGKDESKCTTSNPSSNTSVSVGASPVIITSPGFPSKYPSNRDCSYIITPQDSSKGLSLTFDVISLDYYKKCCDYIEIGIYNTEDKICTNYTNELFLTNERYTSGGETYLHFYSDASYEGYGFRVRIIQVDLGATQPPTAASTTAVQTVVSTTSETTAASTTASQTTKTTAASATVGTTAETTSETTPTSETTAAPATVHSVSSTTTASTAESTAAPHTDLTTETIESNETTQDSTTTTSSTSMTTKPEVEVRVSSTELPPTTPFPKTTTTEFFHTTSSTSMTTKPEIEVRVSSTELPPTTSFPKTATTDFFDGLTTPAKVVALTGLVFLGVVPLCSIGVFCLRKKSKKPSRDNQSHNPYFKRDAQYYNTYHYPMTHKPLFYQYWGEY